MCRLDRLLRASWSQRKGVSNQSLQGLEDLKERMFSFGSSVVYHQCSRSCSAPVLIRMGMGNSLEMQLVLWAEMFTCV